MEIAPLLMPLVGGFFFAESSFFLRYQVAREDGHRRYFRSAAVGVLPFLLIIGFDPDAFKAFQAGRDEISRDVEEPVQ